MWVLSSMWTLCENMKTLNMFVSLLFLSGAFGDCKYPSKMIITTPQRTEALSGSCLKIPCTFTASEFNSTRQTSAKWIRNLPFGHDQPEYEVYDSRNTTNIYPMRVTGNLQERNCTTDFFNLTTNHSDTYYLRIINLPFQASAVCSPLQIIVKDSPASPRLEVSGDPTDLKENQRVTITCSAPTPCPHSPPGLTWSLRHLHHSQTEENPDGTFTTKIQQDVTLSDQHDGLRINCSAVYPVDGGRREETSEAELTLNVSYAPKETSASISPSGLVSAGSLVNLSCSSRARPAATHTWFKTRDHQVIRVSGGNSYSFNVTDDTEGGLYYCVAQNALGNMTSGRLRLTVQDEDVGDSQRTGLGVFLTLKMLGIVALYGYFIIFQCWFRRFDHKLVKVNKDSKEEDYVNAVMESSAS